MGDLSVVMEEASPEGDVARELRLIWKEATADSISSDLRRAEELAASAPPEERQEVETYLQAIRRLEHWLHDR